MQRARAIIRSLVLSLPLVLTFGGCPGAEVNEQTSKEEIRVLLEEFLPVLGEAYAQRDATLIRPFVAEKEIARVNKRLEELSDQGQVYEPTLQSITIEDVNVWSNSNAFVSTLEVWDVRRLAAGTEQVLTVIENQRNRVKYQMKRDTEGWRVLYRTIVE